MGERVQGAELLHHSEQEMIIVTTVLASAFESLDATNVDSSDYIKYEEICVN